MRAAEEDIGRVLLRMVKESEGKHTDEIAEWEAIAARNGFRQRPRRDRPDRHFES